MHQSPIVNVGNYKPYYGDLDSNGWPQKPRENALRAIAPSQAVMISEDLHFTTILQQGIDDWGDGFDNETAELNIRISQPPRGAW